MQILTFYYCKSCLRAIKPGNMPLWLFRDHRLMFPQHALHATAILNVVLWRTGKAAEGTKLKIECRIT